MENTIENKKSFFAQYWGQEISFRKAERYTVQGCLIFDFDKNRDYLELTPLSMISDEDALKVGVLHDVPHLTNQLLIGHSIVHWLRERGKSRDLNIEIIDFLRSKGYALPFMGVSVETLVEWGWVKLKTE